MSDEDDYKKQLAMKDLRIQHLEKKVKEQDEQYSTWIHRFKTEYHELKEQFAVKDTELKHYRSENERLTKNFYEKIEQLQQKDEIINQLKMEYSILAKDHESRSQEIAENLQEEVNQLKEQLAKKDMDPIIILKENIIDKFIKETQKQLKIRNDEILQLNDINLKLILRLIRIKEYLTGKKLITEIDWKKDDVKYIKRIIEKFEQQIFTKDDEIRCLKNQRSTFLKGSNDTMEIYEQQLKEKDKELKKK